jgi:hypothetical protein
MTRTPFQQAMDLNGVVIQRVQGLRRAENSSFLNSKSDCSRSDGQSLDSSELLSAAYS